MNYFECKVTLDRQSENGIKPISEVYLVENAFNFTEVEKLVTDEVSPFACGEFNVSTIRKVKFAELFTTDDGDRYFRFKVLIFTLDADGNEKQTSANMLQKEFTLEGAVNALIANLQKTMYNYKITAVVETLIMDVFQYQSPETVMN